MKKYVLILSFVCVAIVLIVCKKSSTIPSYIKKENIDKYRTVADYLQEHYKNFNYKESNDFEMKTINLNEGENIEEIKDEVKVAKSEFDSVWFNESSCIFWQDERKILGILFSSNPKKNIKELRKWYNGMESERIDDDCYCIGQWNHQ